MKNINAAQDTLSIAITGSGGSGVVTMGLLCLKVIAAAGYYGLMTRSSGPQIRGGESAVMLRLGASPVSCQDDSYKLLLALDWLNFSRFSDEIPLTDQSVVLYDPAMGDVPPVVIESGAQLQEISLKTLAKSIEGGRPNMVALGMLAGLLNIDKQATEKAVNSVLGRKGAEVIATSMNGINIGLENAPNITLPQLPPAPANSSHWNISGNEAVGLGALRGGVRLVAAYPITPATEVLEWMAPNLEKVGGALIQAEDELASINMIIGASFGGVPALTATSGPGLSLMMEALGLAVASETPLVVINVMRGGPSTGIPTKSEQADLNAALYGMHGDAPHLVLAPLAIADCAFTSEWAVRLAERLQAVAIVLSDQSLGQSRAIVDPPQNAPVLEGRSTALMDDCESYQRYALTADGISQMAIPGTAGCIYTADGLEHTPEGIPSSVASDHQQQLDKRHKKLAQFDYGEHWAEQEGQGDLCLITWGSSSGVVNEAAQRLRSDGRAIRTLAIRLLSPLPEQDFRAALEGVKQILVIEQNHQGQLFHYLNSLNLLPETARVLAHSGPLAIRPNEIIAYVRERCEDG